MDPAPLEPVGTDARPATWLGRGSIVGLGSFALVVGTLHLLSSDLNPQPRFISEYANGPYQTLLSVGFWALGLGSLLLTAVLWRMASGAGWEIGVSLLGLWGVAVVLDGVFPIDPGAEPVTPAGKIHLAAAMTAFLASLVAALVLSGRFRTMPAWATLSQPALLGALLMLGLFGVGNILSLPTVQGPMQRSFAGACLACLLLVAGRVYQFRRAPHA